MMDVQNIILSVGEGVIVLLIGIVGFFIKNSFDYVKRAMKDHENSVKEINVDRATVATKLAEDNKELAEKLAISNKDSALQLSDANKDSATKIATLSVRVDSANADNKTIIKSLERLEEKLDKLVEKQSSDNLEQIKYRSHSINGNGVLKLKDGVVLKVEQE